MLEEYLYGQIEKITKEKDLLLQEMQELMEEEARENQQIQKLMDQEDVGIELFSPRNPDSKIKVQIENIRKHIDELQYKQAELSSRLETNQAMLDKWQKLLYEAKEKHVQEEKEELNNSEEGTEQPENRNTATAVSNAEDSSERKSESPAEQNGGSSEQTDTSLSSFAEDYAHELREIQRRVNYCLAIIGKDRNKCKGELKSLQYYVNALLADVRK